MGWFSSKTKYYVSSVVYNLLGDQEPSKYMPTNLISGAIVGQDLGDAFKEALFNGGGARFKNFIRWARRPNGYNDVICAAYSEYYPEIGFNIESLTKDLKKLHPDAIEVYPHSNFIVGRYDITYIADTWVVTHRPDMLDDPYSVDEYATVIRTWQEWETRTGTREVTIGDNGPTTETYTYKVLVTKHEYRQDIKITYSDGSYSIINTSQYKRDVPYIYGSYDVITQIKGIFGIPVNVETTYYLAYQKGSGNADLDEYFAPVTSLKETYTPYIPIRLNNTFISEDYLPDVWKWTQKAYVKATGGRKNQFKKMIDNIGENKSIGDIDYAYMVFGISLSSPYPEAKRYIFEFFKNLVENKKISDFMSGVVTQPDYGNKWFVKKRTTSSGIRTIQIKSDWGVINYNTYIEWGNNPEITKHNGVCKPNAKAGDYFVEAKADVVTWTTTETVSDGDNGSYEQTVTHSETQHNCYFYHQISENRYEAFKMTNLTFANYVYHGKWVVISCVDAFNDDGPNESGFIVPIQEQSFMEAGLMDVNQLAQSMNYIVFNCWEKKKVRWYQRGIFKAILIIIVTVIAVICAIWSGGSSLGWGGAIVNGIVAGATATTVGIVAAVITNMLIATILCKLITLLATKLFGEEIGAYVGLVGTVVVMALGNAMTTTASFIESATNPILVSNLACNAYTTYCVGKTQEYMDKLEQLSKQYEDLNEELEQKWLELIPNKIDENQLIITIRDWWYDWNKPVYASSTDYINSHLLLPSDTREFQNECIHNLFGLTCRLPLPGIR